ncbi:YraN family protein [Pseudoalteromonas sp. NBT06-2]|uniref:YraN family protein n=1 Tax=Pseudoalteromonas sp. NBT06-2 TaxID=2025950 RepID=UPI000BA5D655|nr:YraN family protein [Pseudoalteromonas sp. NBT06-2]PAJ72513.1 YraN family protein [Pseudoalteromonas sp. NBT06-2]
MEWLKTVWHNSRQKGFHYEKQAENYLKKHGLKPISRNYWCKLGEIDLIMAHQETIVFIEVKYRKSKQYGGALNALTCAKQNKLKKAIQHYIQHHQLQNNALRVDFVAINGQNPYQFNWIKNVL